MPDFHALMMQRCSSLGWSILTTSFSPEIPAKQITLNWIVPQVAASTGKNDIQSL